ncbi:MAG: hypothetical protein O3C21_09480 [Verrucomicrobia bacterium]|nr:hypothetical protein [Verrucomicrobiota bacterium]
MKSTNPLSIVTAIGLPLSAAAFIFLPALSAAAEDVPWKSLFEGKTLEGWEQRNGTEGGPYQVAWKSIRIREFASESQAPWDPLLIVRVTADADR